MRNSGSGCGYGRGALAFAFAIVMAALPPAATASDADTRAFLGFWEGVDPLDGSTAQVSISDIDGDGIVEIVNGESFWTICFQRGANYSLGRGLVVGQGRVVSKRVLEVETRLTCIDDDNHPAPPSEGTFQWTLESRGRILLLPEIDQSPAIPLHRIARYDRGKPVIRLGALITLSETGDPDTQAAIRLATEDVNAFFAGVHNRGPQPRIILAPDIRAAIQLVTEEVSASFADAYNRRPRPRVILDIEGTGLDPDVAMEKIELLANRRLHVVIGPESSAEVETVAAFANANDMVLLSHCSAAPSLAIPGDNVYRMVPSDLHQAAAIARLIEQGGYDAIVPMWRAGVWGDDISSAVKQEFALLGGTVYPGVRFDPEATDFSDYLADLNAQVAEARASFSANVAVAFFSFGTEGAAVLAQAAVIPALGAVAWYGSDGTALSREILGDPVAAEFAIQTGFFNTLFADVHTPVAVAVRERISAAIGGGGVHFCSTAAYDAVWLAALTAAATGTDNIGGFKLALIAVAGSYEGATGRTTLDAAGDRVEAAYDVWAIAQENGQYDWVIVAQ